MGLYVSDRGPEGHAKKSSVGRYFKNCLKSYQLLVLIDHNL
jgi:hypothetical protein